MKLAVRAATPDDVAMLVALEQACLGADAWSEGLVASAVHGQTPTVTVLVAVTEPDLVVGYAVTSVVDDVAELQRVGVEGQHRRGGVASALVEAVLAEARRGGAARLLLEVRTDNAAALALYRRLGFADLGRRERYYRDGAAALVLARPVVGAAAMIEE